MKLVVASFLNWKRCERKKIITEKGGEITEKGNERYGNYFETSFPIGTVFLTGNLLCLSNSIKMNKLVNADKMHLVNWLNANKI